MINALQGPRVESFTLRGVHGYKDLAIKCAGTATIIAAENGTGKTTLLNAMQAFLSGRLHRLAALSFHSLECKFYGRNEPVVLFRDQLSPFSEALADMVSTTAITAGVSEEDFLDFIQGQYASKPFEAVRYHQIVHQTYLNSPGDHAEVKKTFDTLLAHLQPQISETAKAGVTIVREMMAGVDIVYLPTYRRIERPMLRTGRRREGATRSAAYGRTTERKEHSYQGIAFGLGDIEARLAELSEEIERTSNLKYRNLSARMLNDMLKGKYSKNVEGPTELPDVDTLSLFLGRLGRVENNLSSLFENIETLYKSKKIYSEEFEFLRYFLARLNTVILETKSLEQRIERFVQVCNSYLMMSSDEKKLEFDPIKLRVVVQNSWADAKTDLDALSSGEKQIVSLMAKLYLYEGEKFVLVDEPELSLSIEWQKKVLPDVVKSGSVNQLIAITHSPFIFDNELDKCAKPLAVSKTKKSA